jgi:hypothetical protein
MRPVAIFTGGSGIQDIGFAAESVSSSSSFLFSFFFFFLDKEILRQYPPETHTPRAEAPRRATQRERL